MGALGIEVLQRQRRRQRPIRVPQHGQVATGVIGAHLLQIPRQIGRARVCLPIGHGLPQIARTAGVEWVRGGW